jgi:1,4-dihydroxy-6-naphthoate synthase
VTIDLTLAHSPDPDDAFMWWPITGKINPDGTPHSGRDGQPAIDTGRFRLRAIPADIHVLNRRAIERADLDITALSVRAYADVSDRYRITRCGASFGDGFGPKIVCRAGDRTIACEGCLRRADVTIAVPGKQTTAFLLLGMVLGSEALASEARFIEMPFERIIPAVARGDVQAGLVIHEGQLTFGDAGLRLVVDVGEWWKQETGLLTPLGVNAVRRDLDARFGAGTSSAVGDVLAASVEYAMERREESTAYTLPFALANTARGAGGGPSDERPTLERVDRYCRMYVTEETRDMGERGRGAIERLLRDGAALGLCPKTVFQVDPI